MFVREVSKRKKITFTEFTAIFGSVVFLSMKSQKYQNFIIKKKISKLFLI